jgi:hypothetical protein
MRRVCAWELVSVEGVMETPEEWAFPYSNAEMEQASASGRVLMANRAEKGPPLARSWCRPT